MRNKPDIAAVESLVNEASDLQEIGSGGFKVVYRADISGNAEAVKLVRIPIDDDDDEGSTKEENVRRILREIKILRECQTPSLVKLGSIAPREVVIDSETYVLYSEELISGQSLGELIRANHQPTIRELAGVGVCLLQAVKELSDMNVIHRDIKPDNIMHTGTAERGHILLDLGIAFHIGGTPLTRDSKSILGTPYYIAPEMLDVDFRQNLDYRADLYTTGLTLYEYASGNNPFRNTSDPVYTTLYRIKKLNPPPLSSLRPDLPMEFCKLSDQLMKKMPSLRPANLPSLLKRMEGFE